MKQISSGSDETIGKTSDLLEMDFQLDNLNSTDLINNEEVEEEDYEEDTVEYIIDEAEIGISVHDHDTPNPFDYSMFSHFDFESTRQDNDFDQKQQQQRQDVIRRAEIEEHWASAALDGRATVADVFRTAPQLADDYFTSEQPISSSSSDDDDDDDDFEDDVDEDETLENQLQMVQEIEYLGKRRNRSAAKKALFGRRVKSYLSDEMRRRLGVANNAFLDGDYDTAISHLREIIRECPRAPEAYHTMAIIHEELDDLNQALLFYMVAAHLRPKDSALWRRVAELSFAENMLDQYEYCLRMAMRADPSDVDGMRELASVYLEQQKSSKALPVLIKLHALDELNIGIAQEIARIHIESGDYSAATMILERTLYSNGFESHIPSVFNQDSLFTLDHYNMMAELYLMQKDYVKACALIGKVINSSANIRSIPVDLLVKYAVSLIHLGSVSEVQKYLQAIRKSRVEDIPDLLMDLGMAFYDVGMWQDALEYLETASSVSNFQPVKEPVVLLKIGECYHHIGMELQATEMYCQFLDKFPNEFELRFVVANLYENMEMHDKAHTARQIATVSRDKRGKSSNPARTEEIQEIIRRLGSIRAQDRRSFFMECSARFKDRRANLSVDDCSHLIKHLRPLIGDFQSSPKFFPCAKRVRPFFKDSHSKPGDDQSDDELEPESNDHASQNIISSQTTHLGLSTVEWYDVNHMFIIACLEKASIFEQQSENRFNQVLLEEALYFRQMALDTIKKACRCNVFYYDKLVRIKLQFQLLGVAYLLKKYTIIYETFQRLMRELKFSNGMSQIYPALFHSTSHNPDIFANRHVQKYIGRILKDLEYKNAYLLSMRSQISALNKVFPASMLLLARANAFLPNHPLIYLNLATSQIQRAMSRTVGNRNQEIVQAFAAMEMYRSLRKRSGNAWEEQEAEYNMGRLYDFIGLNDLAIHHYRKVIDIGNRGDLPEGYDLSMEARHNMFLIFFTRGSDQMTHFILSSQIV